MTKEIPAGELLLAAAEPAYEIRVPATLPVTYKGVGRSSGNAPRAVKAIVLNRLLARYGRDALQHAGGDSYTVNSQPFTFRVTTSAHRHALPWFNVSAREVEEWSRWGTLVIVIGVQPLATRHHFTGLIAVLRADAFGNLAALPTKASESHPSALFEIKYERPNGFMLINSTAREQAPPVKIADCLTKFDLSMTEAKFLTDAYSVQKDIDPTSGGRFKPLTFLVDPGEASPEEIGELLAEVSKLYRMVGGSGITFSMTDVRRPEGVSV